MTITARPLLLIFQIAVPLAIAFSFAAAAQAPRAAKAEKTSPVVFGEITGSAPIFKPIAVLSKLPVAIKASEYSLDYARRTLLPAMGGSIAVGDFDGDGPPTLYVVIPGAANHLLTSRVDGSFVDVTERARVQGGAADLGAAFGDFDKSGHASLFVAGLGGVTLYRNNGDGTFTDATAKAGLKGKPGELATSVLLFDADNDGFLDVLVTVYTDLSAPPSKPSFTFPNDFSGASSRLYRNNHDGTFTDVTEAAGLTTNPGRTHAALAADFEHNGRQDVMLLRDDKPPVFFRNQGHGTFEDKTWDVGTEIWKYAYVQGQAADFDHDGKADAILWSTIGNEVLLSKGDGKLDQDESLPLVYAANRPFGFHGLDADFDEDGWDDLLTVDVKGAWHLLLNRKGRFEEAPFEFAPENKRGDAFAAMVAVHLGKAGQPRPGKVTLIGLTTEGRLELFARR